MNHLVAVIINLTVKDESPLRCVYLMLTATKLTYSSLSPSTSSNAAAIKFVWWEGLLFYKATTRKPGLFSLLVDYLARSGNFCPLGSPRFTSLLIRFMNLFPLLPITPFNPQSVQVSQRGKLFVCCPHTSVFPLARAIQRNSIQFVLARRMSHKHYKQPI